MTGPFSNPINNTPLSNPIGWANAETRRIQNEAAAAGMGPVPIVAVDPAAAAAARAAQEAEQAARRAEHERAIAEARAAARPVLLERLATHGDPIEALVLAARHWLPDLHAFDPLANFAATHRGGGRRTGSTLALQDVDPRATYDAELWAAAFPQWWASAAEVALGPRSSPWDTDAVLAWAAQRAKRQRIAPTRKVSKKGVFGWKDVPGWYLISTTWHAGSRNGESPAGPSTMALYPNGQHGDGSLAPSGLQQLAEILDLSDPLLAMP